MVRGIEREARLRPVSQVKNPYVGLWLSYDHSQTLSRRLARTPSECVNEDVSTRQTSVRGQCFLAAGTTG